MLRVILPKEGPKPSYYNTFIMYIRKILESCSIPYYLEGMIEAGKSVFSMPIDENHKILVDFSDHTAWLPAWDGLISYFKFHYVERIHGVHEKMYPFAPVSFYDWNQYAILKSKIIYRCNSDVVLNMQNPHGGALERRTSVQKMLKESYGKLAVIERTPSQVEYWKRINDCLVHVFVPGARNDMLDRGQLQYMAFGCCTVAPPIVDELPYGRKLLPGTHYVQCNSDYSDLLDKIEWCRNNRSACVEIGRNAKQLFEATCLPDKLWNWILEKV